MIWFPSFFHSWTRNQVMGHLASVLVWIYCTCLVINVDANVGNRCSFPKEWRGKWFQNGYGDFEIKKHYVSKFGHCSNHEGNKYLLFDKSRRCFKCLVFTSQHVNLLQYKESYCASTNVLQQTCDQITGDFPLHTIVKVSGSPIPCPFQGHYSFSYTNGSEVKCENPMSSIQACADSSQFMFNHRRCPQVTNTYDKSVSLQCLATWDNGVDAYLYGRFTGPHLNTKKSQYRCFMYNLYGSYGVMSMTADATCLGLQSPSLGMHVYHLRYSSDDSPQPKCQFPEFFSLRKEWRDVNGRLKYVISKHEDKFSISEIPESSYLDDEEEKYMDAKLRVVCLGEVDSVENGQRKKVELLTYVTDDSCTSSYRCVRLMQRTQGVVVVQIGQATEDTSLACEESNFRETTKNFLLPLTKTGEVTPVPCPMKGVYNYMDKTSKCSGKLDVSCSQETEMVVSSRCGNKQAADVLHCYANWTEFDHVYVIAGQSGDLRMAADCLVYTVKPNGYELKADHDCGPHRVMIRDSPIDFSLNSPASKSCQVPPTPPTAIIHEKDDASNEDNRIYDTDRPQIKHPDVIETPPGDSSKTTSEVINRSSERTSGKLFFLILCFLIVLIFQR